jgi:UDP-GlcNAc:undecaprenyl-phosphate GlcNAc-1-phosphate transferase
MREYVLTLLVAAAVTYVLTPLVRRFAIAVGAMHAARDRDVHVVPTPLLGGFAMYAGLVAGLVVASQLPSLNSVFADTNMARGLLLAGGLVVVMGFVDDRWGMGVISKLAGQVAAGVILVWSGAEVTWLPAPHGTTLGLTSDQQIAVTILVVVITINAVNWTGWPPGSSGSGPRLSSPTTSRSPTGWACPTRPGPRWRPPSWPGSASGSCRTTTTPRAFLWAIPARC